MKTEDQAEREKSSSHGEVAKTNMVALGEAKGTLVNFRISDDQLARLNRYCEKFGPTKSQAMRLALKSFLDTIPGI